MNTSERLPHSDRETRGNALFRYVIDVFRRPFRPLSSGNTLSSLAQRNQERRRAITRLFLLFTGIALLGLALPLSFFEGLSSPTLAVLALIAGLSFGGLWLAERGLVLIPATLFAVGGIIAVTIFAVAVGTISNTVYLGFITFPLFIVIAGLILPPQMLALTTGLGMSATGLFFALLPTSAVFATHQIQLSTGFQLLSVQLLTAVLIWLAARSADSGILEAEAAYQRERTLAELQDHFITDANHELRTPIMAWFTSTELLTKHDAHLPDERRLRLQERALRSGEQVLRLLDSIMDATLLESRVPPLHLSFFDIGQAIRETAQTFDPHTAGEAGLQEAMATERELRIRVAPATQVWADETRVRQILTNLLSNAMKYSAPGTPIDIEVEYQQAVPRDPSASRQAIIHVRDFGLGVPSDAAPQIFQRFVRLERDIAGNVRGTGVGLYLCRVFVEAMAGRIWVESTGIPGEGSRFSFTLPMTHP
ncbi:MAG: HAMP domain-containing histidine kinase [Ktedonobacterales bacterium]|nr:HAMP domain-containing histidine kinase [Ktedonobacterales bacterium]